MHHDLLEQIYETGFPCIIFFRNLALKVLIPHNWSGVCIPKFCCDSIFPLLGVLF